MAVWGRWSPRRATNVVGLEESAQLSRDAALVGGRSGMLSPARAGRGSVCALLHNGNALRTRFGPEAGALSASYVWESRLLYSSLDRTKEGRWQKRLWHCSRVISVESPRVPRSRSGSTVRTELRICVTRTFRCSRRTAGFRDGDARPPPRSRISGFVFKRLRVADVRRSRPAAPNLQGAARRRPRPPSPRLTPGWSANRHEAIKNPPPVLPSSRLALAALHCYNLDQILGIEVAEKQTSVVSGDACWALLLAESGHTVGWVGCSTWGVDADGCRPDDGSFLGPVGSPEELSR